MSLNDQIEGVAGEVQSYVEARIEHTQLQTVEKATNMLSSILGWICIASVAFILTLLVTVLAIFLIKEWVGGFLPSLLIVASFYLIALLLMVFFRSKILTTPLKNKILGIYFETEKNA